MNKEIILIKRWLAFFMVALVFSGLTALPTEAELAFLTRLIPPSNEWGEWFREVYKGVEDTNDKYPFIAYGYDWLAFAHFILAILFTGPYREPVRNKWVIEFGIIACLCIIPFAFIAGQFRGIPVGWRMIDGMFGVLGLVPLLICRSKIKLIENGIKQQAESSAFYLTA